jgi:hypothetical protein
MMTAARLAAVRAGGGQVPRCSARGRACAEPEGSITGHCPAAAGDGRPSAPGGVTHRHPLTCFPRCRTRPGGSAARIRSGAVLRIMRAAGPAAQPIRCGPAAPRLQSAAGDGRWTVRGASGAAAWGRRA